MTGSGLVTGLDVHVVDLGNGVRAGFSSRSGGTSVAPYDRLNLGLHVGDDGDRVLANRDLLGSWLGAPVTVAEQVHGSDVAEVARSAQRDRAAEHGPSPQRRADGLVTTSTGVGIGVMVADCVPVLLADPDAGVVATAHAGRPGLVAGVVTHAVAAMVARGAVPGRVRAALGPSICGRCYEVPAGMRREVEHAVPGTASTTSWGTPAVDISAGVLAQLRRAGVEQVTETGICTYEDERFFSYRRDGVTGRFAGAIALIG